LPWRCVLLNALLRMPLHGVEAQTFNERLSLASFQKTYGSQTPPVLNIYFSRSSSHILFHHRFVFLLWLREAFHAVFPVCFPHLSILPSIGESPYRLSRFLSLGYIIEAQRLFLRDVVIKATRCQGASSAGKCSPSLRSSCPLSFSTSRYALHSWLNSLSCPRRKSE
jgi:hypothetical protein